MTRLKSIPVAVGAVVLSAGTVFAFTALPDAATPGLTKASDAAGRTVPARDVSVDAPVAAPAAVPAVELPDAASHGSDVSAAATAEDTTPDTTHGADVSAVAKDNHGTATAAEHRPADAGKPADVGPPDGAGKPAGAGKPVDPGQPADPGAPDGAGQPDGLPTHP